MVLNRIDPDNKYISHRLYRDSCLPMNGNYIKDLNVLGRDINKTIIIDNSIIAFSLNLDNAIPIHSYSGNKDDRELCKLVEIMDYALNLNKSYPPNTLNLREYLTSMFGLKERINFWQAQWFAAAKVNVHVNSS
jgi:NLI interacting factor-like phosphatase